MSRKDDLPDVIRLKILNELPMYISDRRGVPEPPTGDFL